MRGAGGTEGGMSTGDVLRVRAAMNPIATVPRALDTVDIATGEPAVAIDQRGYGRSSKFAKLEDYRIHKLVDDLVGVVRALFREHVEGARRRPRHG